MSRIMLLTVISIYTTNKTMVKSAPKLGPILFDPLSFEANLTRNISNKQHVDESSEQKGKANVGMLIYDKSKTSFDENVQKPCSGYEFDETLCKTVEDRVMCGYNKNVGNITEKIINLGNGCRIRGNRLECGYLLGPFINSRRPPARNYISDNNNDNNEQLLHEPSTKKSTKADSYSSSASNYVIISSSINSSLNLLMTMSPTVKTSKRTPTTSEKSTVLTVSTTPLVVDSTSASMPFEFTKNPYKSC